ncbi:ABC transporter substrate-binding protein [Neogemmobacter tilapiae]|uniref:Probable sugar-binding periplasmic protein n=1 Tax=Neogemmobacter tilapiae TaxID=875041 RepID=A0A918TTY8_9RHOB|nr:ABC transporter substrate-binding protein [Gemmobacter tilapiae]GHC61091.1 sugar ABC transporter substrate-binding protein [Gemmobacter tilapiae]
MRSGIRGASLLTLSLLPQVVQATELEVTHWWTSGGESAAVAEFAKAFDASGDHWVDQAIFGSGGTARPIIVSRILGGDPMGATQLNHGLQAQELIDAGVLQDITDVAEAEGWRDIIQPVSLLDSCTIDGKVYCAPVNIHSWQWLWLSNEAFEKAGVPVPTNWDEYVASSDALRAAGILPLAVPDQPRQIGGLFEVLSIAIAGKEVWAKVNVDKDEAVAAGPEMAKVFEAADMARAMSKVPERIDQWNHATKLVIEGKAAGQIVGDWAQGEFQVAGQTAGQDYTCLPGLGVNRIISTGGDAFYFPTNDDPDITAAQKRLASLLVSPAVQVAFNLKKGSLPIRGDIDLASANDCMKQGLDILASGNILPSGDMLLSPETNGEIEDLLVEFWNSDQMTATDLQAKYAEIIARAQ